MNAPDIHPPVSRIAPERLAETEDRGEKGGLVDGIDIHGSPMTGPLHELRSPISPCVPLDPAARALAGARVVLRSDDAEFTIADVTA